ncbi:hypothetical protein FDG2_4991 [Candidatus Protofrankia californiensis]|uniref:Uncharacterized protein n=1 Tax=Candidatus Protofrankia californiensis TaxID=1839754 RepID=A0A1C3PAD3_9ACTN|nr:hypothetical protein FDG2_4991 [Candidatus Protofrankia californiensis]
MFLSSHILSEVQHVASRVAVLRRCRLVAQDTVDNLRHDARQHFEAYFDGPVPLADLKALPGVADLHVNDGHARWTAVGPLQPVLAVLAAHPVRTLVGPRGRPRGRVLRHLPPRRLPRGKSVMTGSVRTLPSRVRHVAPS